MSLCILYSVLLGLAMGLVYSITFMRHQIDAFSGASAGNKPYFMRSIVRYGLLLGSIYLILYSNIFNIWWVIGSFSLAFWVSVIRRLRAGL